MSDDGWISSIHDRWVSSDDDDWFVDTESAVADIIEQLCTGSATVGAYTRTITAIIGGRDIAVKSAQVSIHQASDQSVVNYASVIVKDMDLYSYLNSNIGSNFELWYAVRGGGVTVASGRFVYSKVVSVTREIKAGTQRIIVSARHRHGETPIQHSITQQPIFSEEKNEEVFIDYGGGETTRYNRMNYSYKFSAPVMFLTPGDYVGIGSTPFTVREISHRFDKDFYLSTISGDDD